LHLNRYTAILIWSFVAITAASNFAAELVPVNGERHNAALVGIDSTGRFQLQIDGKIHSLAAAQIIRWGAPVEKYDGPLIVAADGSLVVAYKYGKLEIVDDVLTCETQLFGNLQIPVERLRGIIFQPPEQKSRRDQILRNVNHAEATTDTVMLRNGDRLSGVVTSLKEQQIQLRSAARVQSVNVRKTVALAFNPTLVDRIKLQANRTMVQFSDGSRTVSQSWTGSQGAVQLTAACGISIQSKPDEIVAVQTFGDHVKYLSDLKPARYRPRPYLSLEWPYRADRNTTDRRLRCGGQRYEKGVGLHSAAVVTYQLDRAYQRFETALGIDDATGGRGSVVVAVYANDGTNKSTQRYKSEVIRGGDAPVPVSIDIRGATRLSVIVDVADHGDQQDHAVLLDARLIP
jgi:hypothetical protein